VRDDDFEIIMYGASLVPQAPRCPGLLLQAARTAVQEAKISRWQLVDVWEAILCQMHPGHCPCTGCSHDDTGWTIILRSWYWPWRTACNH